MSGAHHVIFPHSNPHLVHSLTLETAYALHRIVEEAVKAVLERRPPLPYLRAGLTAQDIFYSQVANIHEVLPSMLAYQSDCLGVISLSADKLELVISLGSIMEVSKDNWCPPLSTPTPLPPPPPPPPPPPAGHVP